MSGRDPEQSEFFSAKLKRKNNQTLHQHGLCRKSRRPGQSVKSSSKHLDKCKEEIDTFLCEKLAITLHPDKSKIEVLGKGLEFLAMRIFYYHKLLKGKNLRKFRRKSKKTYAFFEEKKIEYDALYDLFEGWCAYAKNVNTYNFRKKIMGNFEERFSGCLSTKEINRGMKNERKKKRKLASFGTQFIIS